MIDIVHSVYSQSVHALAPNAGLVDNQAERYCTKNVGAILIRIINKDLNALQFTSTMNHTLSDIMSVHIVI